MHRVMRWRWRYMPAPHSAGLALIGAPHTLCMWHPIPERVHGMAAIASFPCCLPAALSWQDWPNGAMAGLSVSS